MRTLLSKRTINNNVATIFMCYASYYKPLLGINSLKMKLLCRRFRADCGSARQTGHTERNDLASPVVLTTSMNFRGGWLYNMHPMPVLCC
jgi:hypothetical protein